MVRSSIEVVFGLPVELDRAPARRRAGCVALGALAPGLPVRRSARSDRDGDGPCGSWDLAVGLDLAAAAGTIEESQAGRLKVQYGSPHCLRKMRELFQSLEPNGRPAPKDTGRGAAVREPLRAAEARTAAARSLLNAEGLVGYWPLHGDCQDHSGAGRHGINHGVELDTAHFNGQNSFIEVPAAGLNLGTGDFTISAWVHTAENFDDVIGDVISQYDATRRKGLNLYIRASAGGYSSHGDDRHAFFGIDDGRVSPWEDCGRPSRTSNYVSNSLTVFDGDLYAAITDAAREEDWSHVFRYRGGQQWEDCGRVGSLQAARRRPDDRAPWPPYAATWNYDWTRVVAPPGVKTVMTSTSSRVYRYAGERRWTIAASRAKANASSDSPRIGGST